MNARRLTSASHGHGWRKTKRSRVLTEPWGSSLKHWDAVTLPNEFMNVCISIIPERLLIYITKKKAVPNPSAPRPWCTLSNDPPVGAGKWIEAYYGYHDESRDHHSCRC